MSLATWLSPWSAQLKPGKAAKYFLKCYLPVTAVFCAFTAVTFAASHHGDGDGAELRWFNIPSQSLESALQTYGQTAGVQVLYESALAEGRRSVAVVGNLSPEDALRVLLSSTDLNVSYTRPEAITIARAPADDHLPPDRLLEGGDLALDTLRVHATADSEEEGRLHIYSEALRADIRAALAKNARTRSGTYRVGLKIWIDGTRSVQKTEIFQSTGDRDRDVAIAAALHGILLSQTAPANTPQPVRISVSVRALLQ
ncbi:STN domain-containing protein [Methyloferula stellata]|uniref:STN domain-containing protein n=1 Tax=Methyloferula stellata TaxID=876270 RepID=UPI00036E90C5|nr:STN domain-containing protein [Methyloferula stellata]